jgi:hypothetical protein
MCIHTDKTSHCKVRSVTVPVSWLLQLIFAPLQFTLSSFFVLKDKQRNFCCSVTTSSIEFYVTTMEISQLKQLFAAN